MQPGQKVADSEHFQIMSARTATGKIDSGRMKAEGELWTGDP
jgi:hypothetical protein